MLSSKAIRHRLIGAYYREDVCDRYGEAHPWLVRKLYWRVHPGFFQKSIIFIHVPRAGGTSVARALFGVDGVGHYSIRAYRELEPALYRSAESFALLRDPEQRFLSAYKFVRHGGGSVVGLSRAFRHLTRRIGTVDDYLDFIQGKPALDLDFVMRPQSWFVCDRAYRPVVSRLFRLGQDEDKLAAFLAHQGIRQLPVLNRSCEDHVVLTATQKDRLRHIYASDYQLLESLPALRGQARIET